MRRGDRRRASRNGTERPLLIIEAKPGASAAQGPSARATSKARSRNGGRRMMWCSWKRYRSARRARSTSSALRETMKDYVLPG